LHKEIKPFQTTMNKNSTNQRMKEEEEEEEEEIWSLLLP
jgi:hypothetical protein